jgi:hypothetical protein
LEAYEATQYALFAVVQLLVLYGEDSDLWPQLVETQAMLLDDDASEDAL